jgi:D-sedoheptulose 7-phosphate isomerase
LPPHDTIDRGALEGHLTETIRLFTWLMALERETQAVTRFGHALAACLERGGRVLTCGNGGSMCDAMHFAEELSGRYRDDRRALAAQALSDPAHLTCVANDYGYERVFARAVEALGRSGDVLLAFSTSGKSRNLVVAAEAARAGGLQVLGLLGRDGGPLKDQCDESIVVPGSRADHIQETHIAIAHLLVEQIEAHLFPAG